MSEERGGPPHTTSILIVEDDRALAEMIAEFLRSRGFDIAVENRGDKAPERILALQPGLVILDLALPGKDGLAVCREVRDRYLGPILMLTARGSDVDEVVGLEIGADDYLAKPVRPAVLLARVRALLRRPSVREPPRPERLEVGDLTIDSASREAMMHGAPLALTSGEFDLLFVLASRAGEVISRRFLYQKLRGIEADDFDRSIDLMVSRLRHKLADASGRGDAIKTIRGVGYQYARGGPRG